MTNQPIADEQSLGAGSRVELYKHLYGHAAGAKGVVVRRPLRGQAKVLVRFDDTGYQISVPFGAFKVVG